MFEAIRYRWNLRKREKELSKIRKSYAKLGKGLSGDKLEELRAEEWSEVQPVYEEIQALKTGRFCQIANRLMVPLPDYSNKEFWENSVFESRFLLTPKGFWDLKKLIRQEKKERREVFGFWFGVIVGGIIGVIGAITGLVAVLHK